MKQAFLVVGPEGSGTKLVTELLIRSGVYGQSDHQQVLDKYIGNEEQVDSFKAIISKQSDFIVLRRSWPHGGETPKFDDIAKSLKAFAPVRVIVTFRAWPTNVMCQLHQKQHAANLGEARSNLEAAYMDIFYWIRRLKLPYTMVSYGDLTRNKAVNLHWLLSELGLPTTAKTSSLEAFIDGGREDTRVKEYRLSAGIQ